MRLMTRSNDAAERLQDVQERARDQAREVRDQAREMSEAARAAIKDALPDGADRFAPAVGDAAERARDRIQSAGGSATEPLRRARRRGTIGALLARLWWATIKLALAIPTPAHVVRLLRARRSEVQARAAAAGRAVEARTEALQGSAQAARETAGEIAHEAVSGVAWSVRRIELTAAAVLGAAIAYLLDPVSGRRRRHMLRDKAFAAARREGRREIRRAQYMAGKARGAVHDKVSTPSPPADDNTLADRVRSEIFRHTAVHSGTVNVGVSRGVVYLRGQVETEEQAEQLAAEARRVPGVIGVQSLLHTAGTPTPHGGAA